MAIERVRWTCPGCNKAFDIPQGYSPDRCPNCVENATAASTAAVTHGPLRVDESIVSRIRRRRSRGPAIAMVVGAVLGGVTAIWLWRQAPPFRIKVEVGEAAGMTPQGINSGTTESKELDGKGQPAQKQPRNVRRELLQQPVRKPVARKKPAPKIAAVGEDEIDALGPMVDIDIPRDARPASEPAIAEVPIQAIEKPVITTLSESEAVKHILAIRGQVIVDHESPKRPVIAVDLSSSTRLPNTVPIRKKDIEILASLPKLNKLDLRGSRLRKSQIEDDFLPPLLWNTELTGLRLAENRITNAGLPVVSRLIKLEHLDLSDTRVTGDGIPLLASLLKLKTLSLEMVDVRDEHLAHFRGFAHLERLDLAYTQVKGPGLAELMKLPRLQSLRLAGTQIDDDSAAFIRRVRQIDEIYILKTRMTDIGLAEIEKMKNLKYINLSGNPMSSKAIQLLQQKNLKMTIEY